MSLAAGVLLLRPPGGHYLNQSAPPPSATFLLQKIPTGRLGAVQAIALYLERGFTNQEQLFTTFRGKVKFNSQIMKKQ